VVEGHRDGMSIFICPDCGHKEPSCWRACSWLKYGVYCSIDEFEVFYPALSRRLRELSQLRLKGKVRLEDGDYVYRLTRNGYVYRLTKEIAHEYSSHGFTEKPKDPFQKKLVLV